MTRSRFSPFVPLFVLALLLQPLAACRAAEPEANKNAKADSKQYIRVTRDAGGQPLAMETSIVRFVPKGNDRPGVAVDLVGAVHVGEKSYYDALNKRFDQYDVVLYELVAPEGTRIPKGGGEKNRHLLAAVQNGMKDLLELEYQLAGIDYTKKHFVRADMTPEQFAESMEDKGESFWTMFTRLMAASMAQQAAGPPKSNELDLLMALFDEDRAMKLKRIMAEQFSNMEMLMNALNGPDGSTLISERNKMALGVLKREMQAGHKKIAIFYGGGHMTDMEDRLVAEFDMKRDGQQWLEAWNLREGK